MKDAQVEEPVEKGESLVFKMSTKDDGSKAKLKDKGITGPARHLVKDIGPRAPGSPGENRTSRFIERELKSLDLDAEIQRFHTPATTAWSEFFPHLFLTVGVLLFPLSNHLSYALVCVGFITFLFEEFGRSPFAWLQRYRRSENVIARFHPYKEQERTVVILAHFDSPRSSFYYHPGVVRLYRIAFLVDFLFQALLFMLFTLLYGGSLLSMGEERLDVLWKLGLLFLIPPAIALLALLHKGIFGKATPGGNDNASGVAVLLQLAKVYSRRKPHNTKLWLAYTGAGDAGAMGLKRLTSKYRRDLRGAYFIVLDQVGRGFPVCYRREGRLIPFRGNRHLLSLSRRISDIHAHYGVAFKRNSLYISEGYQLLSRGKRALTIGSREKSRYPRYWRWQKDDYSNIDPRTLRLTADFVQAMVDNIDRGNLKKKK
jgi:hypothetical protein